MKHLVVLAFVLAACKDKAAPPPPSSAPPPDDPRTTICTSALASFDRFVDTGDPTTPEQRTQIRAALVDRCVKDRWSDPAVACMKTAASSHDVMKCWTEHLTSEQRDAAKQALGTLKQ